MKIKKYSLFAVTALTSLLLVAGCSETKGNDTKIEIKDNREDAYTVISGSTKNEVFVADGDSTNFKSLYEASNWCFENCENGSYVKKINDDTNKILFQKRTGEKAIGESGTLDQWFYYRDGETLDGYSNYLTGDTKFFKNEKVSRMMVSTDSLKPTYQPYGLVGRDNSASTQAWNLLLLQDASVRYNVAAFTGIRKATYKFDLSKSSIVPSFNNSQKAVPMITLSQTDSYNWSNQGIYMDTNTGNWYYLYGETQSELKDLNYDDKEVILTSTRDEDKQTFTPNGDVEMTLEYVFNDSEQVRSNDLKIDVINGSETKSFAKNYEYTKMNGRGTPRANVSLDLIPTNSDVDEVVTCPDYMCGAKFNNIVVSKAEGSVPAGLTNEDYQGDSDMVCKPGETYNLMMNAEDNDADSEVILDNTGCVSYDSTNTTNDVFNISFAQVGDGKARTDDVIKAEELIAAISDTDTSTSNSVLKAKPKFDALASVTQKMVKSIDGMTQLEEALDR
jgi:hypothetical protein